MVDIVTPYLFTDNPQVHIVKCCVCKKKKDASLFHQRIGWLTDRWIVCKICATMGKHCSRCETFMPFSAFPRSGGPNRGGVSSYCFTCKKAWSRENYKKKGKDARILARETARRLKLYDLTPEQYAVMFEQQGGVCAVCGSPPVGVCKYSGELYKLAVDHNHRTGQIRELLCGNCNVALGNLKDNPDRIRQLLAYAEKWKDSKS